MGWSTHSLAAFRDDGDLYGGSHTAQFTGGTLSRLGSSTFWRFALPDLTLSPSAVMQIEVTFAGPGPIDAGTGYDIYDLNALDALSGATFDDFATLGDNLAASSSGTNAVQTGPATYVSTIGPEVYAPGSDGESFTGYQTNFDTLVATGLRPFLMFRMTGGLTGVVQVRSQVLSAAVAFSPPAVRRHLSPLRRYPRNDGLAGSPRRVYPPPSSTQASNRRAGGYL